MEFLELINAARNGDKDSRDLLIEKNMGLVWSIVRRFSHRGHDPEDLFQIGVIGLMKAIDHFDTNFDVKFSTYAVPMISGEIKRFLRDDGMIKVSRSIKEHAWCIQKAREKFGHDNGREASVSELCACTGLDPEDVMTALEAGAEVESLNKTIFQSDGQPVSLMDKLEEKNNGDTSLSFDSRAVYWQTRVEEFESSPLIGIGFSSVDIDNEKGSNFNAESGQVESGSSWLSALSMTGLLGGLALVSVFVSAIAKAWKLWTYTPLLSSFLISLSVFWIFHMMAEGYIFAGGSTMAFCVWILLGIIYGVSENKELAYELQRKLCK